MISTCPSGDSTGRPLVSYPCSLSISTENEYNPGAAAYGSSNGIRFQPSDRLLFVPVASWAAPSPVHRYAATVLGPLAVCHHNTPWTVIAVSVVKSAPKVNCPASLVNAGVR